MTVGLRRNQEFKMLSMRAVFSQCGSTASPLLLLADPPLEGCHCACMLLHTASILSEPLHRQEFSIHASLDWQLGHHCIKVNGAIQVGKHFCCI